MLLRHVSDRTPGIRRHATRKRVAYFWPDGRRVHDRATLKRIRSLVIPPAWQDVWICPVPNGHIQAIGRDARRRKQYRYHPQWIAERDAVKFERMAAFGSALPRLRRKVEHDLRSLPLSRPRVLATVVRLLERTLIRIGNDEYARANRSYGLTTLRNRHVEVRGSRMRFKFRAKSGVLQQVELDDPMLARSVKRLQELPGQTLFQYVDPSGVPQKIDSADVNEYLRSIAGNDFTAKDVRTWFGTVLAAMALEQIAGGRSGERSATTRKKDVVAAIDQVKEALGNTRAVCRKCYVHPAVLEAYFAGETIRPSDDRKTAGLTPAERAVLDLLRRRSDKTPHLAKTA
jgi:DNA topoisomerase I